MNTIILAIDLGKYKSVVCLLDSNSGEFRFITIDTSKEEMRAILTRATGCRRHRGMSVGGLGPRSVPGTRPALPRREHASEAWKFKHLKRKTDKDDALRLAQLHLLGQLPTVTLPPTTVRQWRSLIACRQTWVGRRVAVQNRIRALFVAQGLPAPRGASAWSTTGLAGIATQAKPVAPPPPR